MHDFERKQLNKLSTTVLCVMSEAKLCIFPPRHKEGKKITPHPLSIVKSAVPESCYQAKRCYYYYNYPLARTTKRTHISTREGTAAMWSEAAVAKN